MKTVGMATVTVMAAMALWAVYTGIRAVPDIKRYLKIRQM
jgi:hypothetical protein